MLGPEGLAEGRVTTVAAGHRSIALTRHEGRYGALDNRCPHQGGPLGEGAIENGWLRCPWHGWDYCPITGKAPGGHEDEGVATFPVEVRDDGVWVAVPPEREHVRTVSDLMVETMVAWGVTHVFGMVGHSNLGLADAMRRQVEAGALTFVGIRHEGAASFAASAFAKLTGRPAACLSIAGPGATNLLTGLWDAKVEPGADPRDDRPGRPAGARPGRLPGGQPARGLRRRRRLGADGPPREPPRRARWRSRSSTPSWGATCRTSSSRTGCRRGPPTRPARGPEGRVGEAGIHPPDAALARRRGAPARGAPAGGDRRATARASRWTR